MMEDHSTASLESIQAVHADLLALSDSRLLNIERLGDQLVAHITEFRGLLDKRARNEQSRQKLGTGQLDFDRQYSVNDEFQQTALRVADDLDLDELDAAQICLEAQFDSETSGRSLILCAILRFHQRRTYLLDCLRLILQLADDLDRDADQLQGLREIIHETVQAQDNSNDSTRYVRRCITSMTDIKVWLQKLMDKLNSASVVGKGRQEELEESTEYQRVSLVGQHESLSIIVMYLTKMDYSSMSNFELILETLRTGDKYDHLLLHYFPAISGYISHFLGTSRPIVEAKALNDKVLSQSEQKPWALTYVHALIRAWWLAEYSGWHIEHHDTMENARLSEREEESRQRGRQFTEALKDGAFDFLLSLSADVKSAEWHDPARHGLRQWLQRKAPFLLQDSIRFADFFQEALEERIESFIEAFIIHMPDVLRKLRVDEDEQRQLSATHDHDLDLERFLVTISFAFEGRPTAAREAFWDAPDGALLGFMHWASKRASTPLVSSFCEMLKALSEDEECATSAHEFLLDVGSQSGKARRTQSLTWNQIFKELSFFCSKIRDRPSAPQTSYGPGKPVVDHVEMEPESFLMLECYLRLIAQLCEESGAARQFLAQNSTFNLMEMLFQLTSSSIQPRLKACAFATLKSLLSHKTKEDGEYLWNALDIWVSGGYSPGSSMPKTPSPSTASTAARILRDLGTGFEEPNSFIQLLHALLSPYGQEADLRDGLPFPENLGATSRMPGVDPYIDFAVGEVFGSQTSELSDTVQARLLRLSCLQLIITCLESFNEDLVIFANSSNVLVDVAIQTSNLQNYVLLHPFSRVMEWMYNEKVMAALFASILQNDEEVARSSPDSPLILCLLKGIETVSLVLELQPTYLDIIRPLIKIHSSQRRTPVSNAAFSSFEDGTLNHLSIVPTLGLYCGSGHPNLVVASLRLLEKLAASPALVSASGTGLGRRAPGNKAIAALQNDAQRVSMILLHAMESAIDINQGPDSPEHIIKSHILDFLIACLQASPNQPNIAHLLLGFQCLKTTLDIDPAGSFNRGISLFHSILAMVLEERVGEDALNVSSWLVSFKLKGLQILKTLWQSPLSSNIVMVEMRANHALFLMFAKQQPILAETRFDGLDRDNPHFLPSDAASCLSEFLTQRAIMLHYVSAELRHVSTVHSPSLKQRVLAALLGTTTADDGPVVHASVFDLFDFMDVEFTTPMMPPLLPSFDDIDLSICLVAFGDSISTYNLDKVKELLLLRRAEIVRARGLENAQEEAIIGTQITDLIGFHAVDNQIKLISASRLRLLQAWTQLALLIIQTGEFDSSAKTSFVLRTLQTILPWLENNLTNIAEALELAKLAKCLLFALDFDSDSFKEGDMGDLVNDRLFGLFQISLRAITSIGANPTLKEYFYSINYRYLTGISDVADISVIQRRPSVQSIRAAGDRFIDVVCDDAYAAEPMCRISALLLLSALVKMAKHENVTDAIGPLVRLNFIAILVDSIQNMPTDLRETGREDVPMQLSYCHARLVLLLHISQTRYGATAVLNAGLFHSVQVSGLFAIDPDLGVDIDDKDAINKHYEILAAIMRVICAAVLSRGSQNEHSLEQGRKYLMENRLSIMAVLKKSAGLGESAGNDTSSSIDELAESFMLLMTMTGFLEFERQINPKGSALKAFT